MTIDIIGPPRSAEKPVGDAGALRLFYQSALDAMTPNVAVVDATGAIVAVNASWRAFLKAYDITEPGFDVGGDYLALCDGSGDVGSRVIAAGLRALLAGGRGPFRHEYRCPWTEGSRWSRMSAVRVGPMDQPFIILTHEDVTEHRRAELRQREIAGRLLLAEDEERQRIGRELHDGAAQKLAAAKLILGSGLEARQREDAQALISEAIEEMRTLAHRLHPSMLEPMGLCAAIRHHAVRFMRESGVAVSLSLPRDFPRLARPVEIVLYRAAQEALDNVARHSGSPEAALTLSTIGGFVRLTVRDHGCGRSATGPDLDGEGLGGLRMRVEQLSGAVALSDARPGLSLTVALPLQLEESESEDGG